MLPHNEFVKENSKNYDLMPQVQLEIKPKSTTSTRPPPLAHIISDLLGILPSCADQWHLATARWVTGNTVFHFWCSCQTSIKWTNYLTIRNVVDQLKIEKNNPPEISLLYYKTVWLTAKSLPVLIGSFQALAFIPLPKEELAGKTKSIRFGCSGQI